MARHWGRAMAVDGEKREAPQEGANGGLNLNLPLQRPAVAPVLHVRRRTEGLDLPRRRSYCGDPGQGGPFQTLDVSFDTSTRGVTTAADLRPAAEQCYMAVKISARLPVRCERGKPSVRHLDG